MKSVLQAFRLIAIVVVLMYMTTLDSGVSAGEFWLAVMIAFLAGMVYDKK